MLRAFTVFFPLVSIMKGVVYVVESIMKGVVYVVEPCVGSEPSKV